MWAWIFLLAAWSMVIFIIGDALKIEQVMDVGAILFFTVLIFVTIFGSVEFLRYYQVWPFQPQ